MVLSLIPAFLAWTVAFPGGQKATVQLPDYGPDDLVTTARPSVHFNPQGTFAAVQTFWSAGVKYDGGDVFLVHPTRSTRRLPGGNVGRLLWTQDGHYLIGAGKTTVRLWNLQGNLRQATPFLPARWLNGRDTIDRDITEVALGKAALCVQASFVLAEAGAFAPTPAPAAQPDSRPAEAPVTQRVQTVSRYSLPALKLLARATVPSATKAPPCS